MLGGLDIEAIPRVGANRAALLHKFRIQAALAFAQAPEAQQPEERQARADHGN